MRPRIYIVIGLFRMKRRHSPRVSAGALMSTEGETETDFREKQNDVKDQSVVIVVIQNK